MVVATFAPCDAVDNVAEALSSDPLSPHEAASKTTTVPAISHGRIRICLPPFFDAHRKSAAKDRWSPRTVGPSSSNTGGHGHGCLVCHTACELESQARSVLHALKGRSGHWFRSVDVVLEGEGGGRGARRDADLGEDVRQVAGTVLR